MLDEIVLIDDDSVVNLFNQKLIQQLIPDVDAKKIFKNGDDRLRYLVSAQDLLRKTLIFLDLHMPVMNGFKFLNIYENALAYQEHAFVVCLLTSSESKQDRTLAARFPSVLAYMIKPLSKDKIKLIIHRSEAVLANRLL